MASPARRRPENVPGDFFVDASCIDCDTCRWMAGETFDSAGDQSRVHRQPATAAERFRAELALIACPTGSIGVTEKHDLAAARDAFPIVVEGDVHHCGYHAQESFGAASYLIVRPPDRGGNVLVDVPRWNSALVRRIGELGGVRAIFLTHIDDVAEHERWAEHFCAERIMHERDAGGLRVERAVAGDEPVQLDRELVAVPTPGHTAGSVCLVFRNTAASTEAASFLFSGDHVAWSRSRGHVYAFRDACWFDWATQIRSMERLAAFDFEWILPGHGTRCRFDRAAMRDQMRRCIEWMKSR